jgi:hypothetical protein
MSTPTCLNCDAHLNQQSRYCAACGQRSDVHRLTLVHILHDFFHAITHADKGIFHLFRELALRPGIVAREYVAGKRKKYFSPFTFFLITMTVYVLVGMYFRPQANNQAPDKAVIARIPSEEGRRQYITMTTRGAEISGFMNKNGNIVAMFAVPFIAFITWCFWRSSGYNFAEFLVASLLFVTFGNLIFSLLVNPLQALFRGSVIASFMVPVGLLLQTCYYTFAYHQFLPSSHRSVAGSFAVSFLAIICWSFLSILVMAVYMYRDWDFYKFFVRMFG